MNLNDDLFYNDALNYITESDNRTSVESVDSNINVLIEHIIKWVFCRSDQMYMWTDGWARTIFRASYHIAVGKAQNNYDNKFTVYDIEKKYQRIRKKILSDPKYKELLVNERIIPKDFPILYNLDLLYRDDAIFDFIIENSYKPIGKNDLIKNFNKYRILRNDMNFLNKKMYNGNRNLKREEPW